MYKNFPRRFKDTSKVVVPNPKKLVDEAMPKLDELSKLMAWTMPLLRMSGLFFACAATIIAEIGNGAITIADIVDDPLSAPFAILGLLIGPLGIRANGPRKGFKSAADARCALDEGK